MSTHVTSPYAAPRIAIVTADETLVPAVQESLVSNFHTTLLNPSDSVFSLLDEVPLEAVIVDLDMADEPNQEGVRLLEGLRRADPDLVLFALPVTAEGRYWTPGEAAEALRRGAHAVVIGTAITNPLEIARRFATALGEALTR